MRTAQLQLSDLDTRASRIEAMLGDPAASSSLLHEACSDTPIVGEVLATLAFAHDAGPAGNSVKLREGARQMLAMILAFRELERDAVAANPPSAPQTSSMADVFRAIGEGIGWVGATTEDFVRGVFGRPTGTWR